MTIQNGVIIQPFLAPCINHFFPVHEHSCCSFLDLPTCHSIASLLERLTRWKAAECFFEMLLYLHEAILDT